MALTVPPPAGLGAAATSPIVTSVELCRRALDAYDAFVATLDCCDEPDLGLAVHIAAGHRALEARLAARAWEVGPSRADHLEALLASAPPSGGGEPAVSWVQTFPTEFLAAIDRRRFPTIPQEGARRAWDRLALMSRARSSGPR